MKTSPLKQDYKLPCLFLQGHLCKRTHMHTFTQLHDHIPMLASKHILHTLKIIKKQEELIRNFASILGFRTSSTLTPTAQP